NRSWKAAVRTVANQVEKSADDKKEAQSALVNAYSVIDRAVSKGVLHKNTAARKKSQLAKRIAP
ncbi:MAG: 30S ribosomal protein S20, partial [Candidatus Obscuribacterales bacterium]|nr:30S ribosomal protein S20 [Candidatus Obscuribacterales bacterium]